jgi:hypothetical protein
VIDAEAEGPTMAPVYRATIDMNVIRALRDRRRARHADARRLLDAAARGDVELAVPPQGSLADLHGQYAGDLAKDIEAMLAKPGVVELPQVARLSAVTFPAENLFPGHFVAGFDEAWNAVAADWSRGELLSQKRRGRADPRAHRATSGRVSCGVLARWLPPARLFRPSTAPRPAALVRAARADTR